MEVLRVQNLTKNFGGLEVLKDISFALEIGQHVAVIGPNGAGKTTLFNVLTGELPVTTGKVYVLGQDVTHMPIHRRVHLGLARSYQIISLLPTLSTIDNVLLAIQGTKPSRFQMLRPATSYTDISANARRLLESMDLWEKKNESVQNLSYGEQRKIEIALSLSSAPRLLLLDEPTTGLTMSESSSLINMINNLARDITILFTAHDMDVVFGLAERIMVLFTGQIIAQGTAEEIQANPLVSEIYLGPEEDVVHAEIS